MEYECKDCFQEAAMDVGVLSEVKGLLDIPEEKRLRFDDCYKKEFYFTHEDPKGWKAKVRPW